MESRSGRAAGNEQKETKETKGVRRAAFRGYDARAEAGNETGCHRTGANRSRMEFATRGWRVFSGWLFSQRAEGDGLPSLVLSLPLEKAQADAEVAAVEFGGAW